MQFKKNLQESAYLYSHQFCRRHPRGEFQSVLPIDLLRNLDYARDLFFFERLSNQHRVSKSRKKQSGRHDPYVAIRAVSVVEAKVALIKADACPMNKKT
jgi:hypothetical protein